MNKLITAVAVGLFTACLLSAQTTPSDKTDSKTDPKPAVKVAPKPGDKTAPKPAPKVEEPKIPGTTITRANGTFLGLEVVGGNFKLSFYDKKKKPMSPDVSRASARWPNPRSVTGPNRTVLNPSGLALVGSKPVLPPFTFSVHLALMQGDGEGAVVVESYDVRVPAQ